MLIRNLNDNPCKHDKLTTLLLVTIWCTCQYLHLSSISNCGVRLPSLSTIVEIMVSFHLGCQERKLMVNLIPSTSHDLFIEFSWWIWC